MKFGEIVARGWALIDVEITAFRRPICRFEGDVETVCPIGEWERSCSGKLTSLLYSYRVFYAMQMELIG